MTRTPHPWAVLGDDGTPLWHVPGTWPPIYERDETLEAIWRAKPPRTVIQLTLWEKAA